MSKSVAGDSVARCFQGAAVPNTTECPPELKNYHPPRDDSAQTYITRLCEVDFGSTEYTLRGLFGWKQESRNLMDSLTFTARKDDAGKVYYEAPGSDQPINGYKFKSWRIDTQEDDQYITFIDVLSWIDSKGSPVKTKWIWNHKI